jgi:hypothetical protein
MSLGKMGISIAKPYLAKRFLPLDLLINLGLRLGGVQGAGLPEPKKKAAGLRGMARGGAGLAVEELGAGWLQGHGSPERKRRQAYLMEGVMSLSQLLLRQTLNL